jgi:hypothetical protein
MHVMCLFVCAFVSERDICFTMRDRSPYLYSLELSDLFVRRSRVGVLVLASKMATEDSQVASGPGKDVRPVERCEEIGLEVRG